MLSLFLHLMLMPPVIADVPNVTLSPDTIAEADKVLSKITKVVLYDNRAIVHRTASHSVSKGVHTLTLPSLPSTINPDSLRLDVPNGTLLRMDTRIVNTEEYPLKELEDIITQMEAVQTEIVSIQHRRGLFQEELSTLQRLTPASLNQQDYQDNIAQYSMTLWKQNWQFIRNQIQRAQSELQSIDLELASKHSALQKLQQQAAPFLQGNLSQTSLELVVVVESNTSKKLQLDLQYTIQGAGWRPTYDVHYDSQTDQARIESAALVFQSSGEHWQDVQLEFATANQQVYRSLPNMFTWTLGEKNEYIPKARPASHRQTPPLYPAFSATTSNSELETLAKREAYMAKRDYLAQLSSTLGSIAPPASTISVKQSADSLYRAGGLSTSGAVGSAYGYAESVVVADEEMDYAMAYEPMMEESVQSRSVALAGMAARKSSRAPSSQRMDKAESYTTASIPLALEASNLYAPVSATNTTFNVATTQAMNLRWEAPGKFAIPSDGQQHRIPIQGNTFQAESFYETTPSLEELAYLKATITNGNPQAILQGGTNIFLNGHFTVQSSLQTTAVGGILELPLGADENIRIKRNITPMQRKEGLIKQQEITDYTVKIEIANYKKKDIAIRVLDQLPITQNDEITIAYLKVSHLYKQDQNSQGILYWDLVIPAGQTETIELQYAITRPKNWKLWGN